MAPNRSFGPKARMQNGGQPPRSQRSSQVSRHVRQTCCFSSQDMLKQVEGETCPPPPPQSVHGPPPNPSPPPNHSPPTPTPRFPPLPACQDLRRHGGQRARALAAAAGLPVPGAEEPQIARKTARRPARSGDKRVGGGGGGGGALIQRFWEKSVEHGDNMVATNRSRQGSVAAIWRMLQSVCTNMQGWAVCPDSNQGCAFNGHRLKGRKAERGWQLGRRWT